MSLRLTKIIVMNPQNPDKSKIYSLDSNGSLPKEFRSKSSRTNYGGKRGITPVNEQTPPKSIKQTHNKCFGTGISIVEDGINPNISISVDTDISLGFDDTNLFLFENDYNYNFDFGDHDLSDPNSQFSQLSSNSDN